MEWASVQDGIYKVLPRWNKKKKTGVKQTKEILITPPIQIYSVLYKRPHFWFYRMVLHECIINFVALSETLFQCRKTFLSKTLLMHLRWPLIKTACFLAKHQLLLWVIDGSTGINSPAEELYTQRETICILQAFKTELMDDASCLIITKPF